MTHSPFHVVENFISPLQCEKINRSLALKFPSLDERNEPLKYERLLPQDLSSQLVELFHEQVPQIQDRYSATVEGQPGLKFQQYWENLKRPAEELGAGAWKLHRKKWTKIKDFDLMGILWLKDFNSSVPLDPKFEVYGGKVEFPGYNFSLTPVRGTLVMFPATPNFVHAISHVLFGSMEQIVITSKLSVSGSPWIYNPINYPGTYQEWFLEESENV